MSDAPRVPGRPDAKSPGAAPTEAQADASSLARGVPSWMAALGLFMCVVGIVNGSFVWLSSHGRRDLVRQDYYEAGLRQDSAIALAAAAGPVSLRRDGGDWLLETAAGSASATGCLLRFYRPDDGRADREVRLRRAPTPAGREAWRGPAQALRSGQWLVTAVWERDGKDVREKTLRLTEP
jgi:hypothetical protein